MAEEATLRMDNREVSGNYHIQVPTQLLSIFY